MDKKTLKELKNKVKEQVIDLPDGSQAVIRIRPKFGKKTKATITWDKSIDNVDLNITISGQPIRCYQEGIQTDLNGDNTFQAEASATYKW